MNTAVCDDDKLVCEEIVRLITAENPEANVISFSSAKEMLRAKENFDICFLDIAMEEMSGIELAKAIRKNQEITDTEKSIIIFITGYREYMEEAFDVNAFHYLIKPIDREKFSVVFHRALKEVTAAEERQKKYIIIKKADVHQKIFLKDIYYIESNDKKVIFHTTSGSFETYGKMAILENELGTSFYRCHRAYLVNMEKISAYSSDNICLINGEQLILSQKKYSDFVKNYMRYAKNGGIVNV